jgi:hypothetical protein
VHYTVMLDVQSASSCPKASYVVQGQDTSHFLSCWTTRNNCGGDGDHVEVRFCNHMRSLPQAAPRHCLPHSHTMAISYLPPKHIQRTTINSPVAPLTASDPVHSLIVMTVSTHTVAHTHTYCLLPVTWHPVVCTARVNTHSLTSACWPYAAASASQGVGHQATYQAVAASTHPHPPLHPPCPPLLPHPRPPAAAAADGAAAADRLL